MKLNLKSFAQLIEDMAAALQGSASQLVDVSIGSVVRAVFEANASVVLWMQWLLLQVMSMSRAATSTGADLDSWMADFGVSRLPATPSTGTVTFSRYATTLGAFVPLGTIVKSSDGLISFAVGLNAALSCWQASTSSYVLPAGVAAMDLPVACLTAGSGGNVLSGAITIIASSLPGIDQVTNALAYSDGSNAESDQAYRARFQSFLASLAKATRTAISAAIANVQQGLIFLIQENVSSDGSAKPGAFLVIVDDGSGNPPSTLLSAVTTAVEAVRPVGTTFAVMPPVVLLVNVSLTAFVSSADLTPDIMPLIQGQIAAYLNTLAIGRRASATRIGQAAYSATTAVQNITAVLLNALPTDVVPPAGTVIKAGQITVAVNAW